VIGNQSEHAILLCVQVKFGCNQINNFLGFLRFSLEIYLLWRSKCTFIPPPIYRWSREFPPHR
jgi:hypothetical protein